MLSTRIITLWMCVLLLGVTGCEYIAPSDDFYEAGAARIGNSYYIYAPLCDDERITDIAVYDNEAVQRDESPDLDSDVYSYWRVSEPLDEDVARGWVRLGDDEAFKTVVVSAGSNMPFPRRVAVELKGTASKEERFSVGEAFFVEDVPSYPAGTDAKTVKYGYEFGTDDFQTLTPEEISKRSKCARDYPA